MNTLILSLCFWMMAFNLYYIHNRFEKQYALIQSLNTPCPGVQ